MWFFHRPTADEMRETARRKAEYQREQEALKKPKWEYTESGDLVVIIGKKRYRKHGKDWCDAETGEEIKHFYSPAMMVVMDTELYATLKAVEVLAAWEKRDAMS